MPAQQRKSVNICHIINYVDGCTGLSSHSGENGSLHRPLSLGLEEERAGLPLLSARSLGGGWGEPPRKVHGHRAGP